MKKLSLILASALLLGSISFAAPVVKHVAKQTPAAKQDPKPATKPAVKKTPMKKSNAVKPAAK